MSDQSDPFTTMAAKIDLNADNGFGGAFVIVPPGEGEPHTMLILDAAQDPALFWSTLKTKVDIALAQLADAEQRQSGGFPGMGRR